jgi:hypothetical protein
LRKLYKYKDLEKLDLLDSFKKFWEVYPNQMGGYSAMYEYAQAIRDGATAKEIMDGAERYRQYIEQTRTEQKYIKRPNNWLREGEYLNRYNTTRGASKTQQIGEAITRRGAIQETNKVTSIKIPERNKRSS